MRSSHLLLDVSCEQWSEKAFHIDRLLWFAIA
jgi:hypothetical protein